MNFYLLGFSVLSLWNNLAKNFFTFLVLSVLIFTLSASLFFAKSLQETARITENMLPDLIVQKMHAGRILDIKENMVNKIIQISGVKMASSRVWGYYNLDYVDKKGIFTIIGIDEYDKNYKDELDKIATTNDELFKKDSMLIGTNVLEALKGNYHEKSFNFIKPDGKIHKVFTAGVFNATGLYSQNMVLMRKSLAKEILGIKQDEASDIVVFVPNPLEVPVVVQKIKTLMPNLKLTSKVDLLNKSASIIEYKSGFFLAIFIVSLLTFFMIVYDRTSSSLSKERKEIAVLKACGWTTLDLIKEKFYEGFIISFLSYIVAIVLSLIFVYVLKMPVLKYLFSHYSDFDIAFFLDLNTMILVFFVVVPIYIGALIFPVWRTASSSVEDILR